MKKTLLMGETGSGKASLIGALSGGQVRQGRALAVTYTGSFINTPGEFLENRRFYSALITASAEAEALLLLQDSSRGACLFPPQFAVMFNRLVIGVITKVDLPSARPALAEKFLRSAGACNIVRTSVKTGKGIAELQASLL